MANLVPQHIQKQVRREYYVRVATVWLFLVAGAFLVSTIALIPTYVLVSTQTSTLKSVISDTSVHRTAYEDAVETLSESEELAQYIRNGALPPMYELVRTVVTKANSKVALSEVHITRNENTFAPLTVQGNADTRAALVAYRDALRADAHFKEVLLPVESLIGDTDLVFSMTADVSDSYEESI